MCWRDEERALAPRRLETRGDERIRTADPLRAKQVLSQLSYIPRIPTKSRDFAGAPYELHETSCYSDAINRVSLRMRITWITREVLQPLDG